MNEDMIERVFRRVQMLFGRGRIALIDDSGPVQMAQMTTNNGMTLDGRYRLTEFGFSSMPPIGSEVLAAHMSGDRTAGVIISTNHQASRPRGLLSGESMLYSEDGKWIYLTAGGGIVVEAAGQEVTVNGATKVTIIASDSIEMDTPLLKVTGDILDNSATNTRTIAQMRTTYNGHDHGGVTAGGAHTATPGSTM